MIETIKVSTKGQIVIPERFRVSLNIKEGSKLIIIEKGKKLILEAENHFLEDIETKYEMQEKLRWMMVAEKSLTKFWNNKKDDETWSKYL
jgi:AbrB family looped-hinge helix DNA binding protein